MRNRPFDTRKSNKVFEDVSIVKHPSWAVGEFPNWPGVPLQVTAVLFAAATALAIAIGGIFVASRYQGFSASVIIAAASLLLASLTSAWLVSFRRDHRPSQAEQQAALHRIRSITSSLLERHGIEDTEIDPPVKLVDTSEKANTYDFEKLIAATSSTSSEFFLAQFMDVPRYTVILGEHGSGKTSLLLRLASRMLTDRPKGSSEFIPLFLKCRDWSESYGSFHKWITIRALHAYKLPVHVTDYWIRTGKLFIGLDGFDELPSDQIDSFSGAVSAWVKAAEGTRLAISARLDRDGARDFLRAVRPEQICVIQPLPDSDIRRYLLDSFSKLSFPTRALDVVAMDAWMRNLVSRQDYLRGPALVGMLAEAVEESEQLPGVNDEGVITNDPVLATFLVANSYFWDGKFKAAEEIYGAVTRLAHSRWHVPAYTLRATCLYLLGEVDQASNMMLESVALRLQESIQATPDVVGPLSAVEAKCLAALPASLSLDLAQVSSAAHLPISLSRSVLQSLRERGLVETAEHTEDRARFRRSSVALIDE